LVGSVPYVNATIELPQFTQEDGTALRVPGILLDDQPAVAIGLPVELSWDETAQEGIKAPRWKISGTAENTWAFPH
ncbi:MAG: hypothetical protein NTZ05_20090, partial [Chloroflexi bacterium]|nr:hypothetical protein [Chloroflexota bacterium]